MNEPRKRRQKRTPRPDEEAAAAAAPDDAAREADPAGEQVPAQDADDAPPPAADERPDADAAAPAGEEPAPSPLETLTAERDELKERWLRAVAELDNVRKRARREVADARRFAQADVLRDLLEIADNLERALRAAPAADGVAGDGTDGLREGVELTRQRFLAVLRDKGVEPIEALGEEFDPSCHEAVGQVADEETEAGAVVEVVQQGYRFGELVLRPARVIIAG